MDGYDAVVIYLTLEHDHRHLAIETLACIRFETISNVSNIIVCNNNNFPPSTSSYKIGINLQLINLKLVVDVCVEDFRGLLIPIEFVEISNLILH